MLTVAGEAIEDRDARRQADHVDAGPSTSVRWTDRRRLRQHRRYERGDVRVVRHLGGKLVIPGLREERAGGQVAAGKHRLRVA